MPAANHDDDPVAILDGLVRRNTEIHESECINLNPAANVMNPAAEALLASSLGTRPSLGDPGDKYEMGLEAVEQIEELAARLAREVFEADHVELRMPSGAIANLTAFMVTCRPGDAIIAPPATIAGHVTHHAPGAAGLYGLRVHEAPIDAERYTVDVEGVRRLAHEVRPAAITIGSSLNLRHHPVAELRAVADEVGAIVVFDAAHLSGLIAGGVWPNPLTDGAHVMTMSTYKSLAGPPAGLLATDDAALAARISEIAFPGLTANFDVANTAALARTLVDWQRVGSSYATEMLDTATALAEALTERGLPVVRTDDGTATWSHAFAIDARDLGGGHAAAQRLRRANLLTSAIGIPSGDGAAIRLGTNELVRWGMARSDVPAIADFVARAWRADDELAAIAAEVAAFRTPFDQLAFTT